MAETNEHRGDVELELGGSKFALRPTFQAMMEIERGTGQSLLVLARKSFETMLSLGEMTIIVSAGMRAAGEAQANEPKVGEMIYVEGLMKLAVPISSFLANALRGGQPAGEATAAKSK